MKLILLFAITFLSTIIYGQNNSKYKDSTRYYDHSQISVGYQQHEFENLNSRLVRYFPRSIPQKHFGLGYGGKSVFNSVIFQGEIGVAGGINSSRGKGSTSSFIASLHFDGGIMLTKPGSVRIYPFAGVGIDFANVTAKIRTDNISFDSVLSNPFIRASTEPVSMTNFFISWRSGLAIDFGNPLKENHPFSFGLKAGYKRSFNNGKWSLAGENNFTDPPFDRLDQWFASIVFYSPINKIRKKILAE